MEKKLKKIVIVCIFLLFCFTGCVQKPPNEDEAELILNSAANHGEAEWKFNYETIVSALTEVDWIAEVEILPDDYEAYMKEKKIIIRITVVEGQKVTEQDREHISDYVKNSGCAEQFDIEYIEKTPNEDEAELILNSTVNHGEAEWKFNYETIVSALTEVDWIAEVEILPDNYETYMKEKKIIIRITVVEGQKVTEQDKEHISDYVKNSGCAEQFDIEYVQ